MNIFKNFVYFAGAAKITQTLGSGILDLYCQTYKYKQSPYYNQLSSYYNRFSSNQNQEQEDKSWAVITGGTDGIGKSVAKQLAKNGFNILIISRSQERLENTQKEILEQCQHKIEVRTIETDFRYANLNKYKSIYEKLDELKYKAIFVNNVADVLTRQKPILEATPLSIQQMIEVNVIPQLLFTKYFINRSKKMNSKIEKNQREWPLLLQISSVTAEFDYVPKISYYLATKRFNKFLAQSQFYNLRRFGIDQVIIQPFYVSTKLTNYRQLDWSTITPDQQAECIIRAILGNQSRSYGHWSHQINFACVFLLPIPIFIKVADFFRKQEKKAKQ